MQRWRMVGLRGRLHLGIGACLAILLMLSSLPAQAADATAIYTNADGITINDSGPATPYASEIEVTGMNYPIIDVNVTLTKIHHTEREYDVYVVLVGPQGQSVFLIRNNGIYQDVDASMGFDDQADDPMPARNETSWYQGTYRPAPDFTSDPCPGVNPLPDPAPSEPSSEGLSIFNDTNPNGTWRLYVGDACEGGDGSIESWSLEITTTPVKAPTVNTNSAGITINSSGAADPYPSEIDVTGMSGVVTDVNITLSGLSHDYPSEVRALLVGPTGGSTFLLRENGTERYISRITLTLDEQAARAIPALGYESNVDERLQSGIFRPAPDLDSRACNGIVPLPSPAPSESLDGTLSVFNGTNPNGTWQLYVGDDCEPEGGSIAS